MTEPAQEPQPSGSRFNAILLGAVVALFALLIGFAVALYSLPSEHLEMPELLPGVRVAAEESFPVGASRIVSWGDQVILVVRSDERRYSALQGISSGDDCMLNWNREAQRVVSPCSNLVFDLQGNVVKGLTNSPLIRYRVFTRGGSVFVGRES